MLPWVISLLDVRHCCKLSLYAISRKTDNPNLRKWQKPIFRPNFGPFGPKNFFADFTSTRSQTLLLAIVVCNFKKNYEPNLRKWQKKPLVLCPILASLAQIGPKKFSSWILPLLEVRCCCKISLYKSSRKTNKSNLRKW